MLITIIKIHDRGSVSLDFDVEKIIIKDKEGTEREYDSDSIDIHESSSVSIFDSGFIIVTQFNNKIYIYSNFSASMEETR